MAITRTDINGDIALLKAALEALVPDFFATVEYDDDTTPTAINCNDTDGNTIFHASTSGTAWAYTAYKNATTGVSITSTSNKSRPMYFYTVGSNGAAIQTASNTMLIIAKTNTGVTGFALPNSTDSTDITNNYALKSACFGDDPTFTGVIAITTTQTNIGSTGNHTLFVPIPLHGTYAENIYLPKAFFLPMAQEGMRGAVQELSADEGTYLTNGYVALLDD